MRPVRFLSAVTAVALVAGGSAAAASTTVPTAAVPPAGSSTSQLTVLTLTAAEQALRAGVVQLLAETLAEPSASATITPLALGAATYGQQSVTAGDAPINVPPHDSAALVPALAGLVSVQTPSFAASAATAAGSATSTAGTTGLGAVKLLGLPVTLKGSVGAVAAVAGTASTGDQTLEITDLALPSVADLLGALGVDLSALPVGVLYELLDKLKLVTPAIQQLKVQLDAAIATIQATVDAAQKAVDDAAAAVIAETAKLAPAQAALKSAQDTLQQRTAAVASARTLADSTQSALQARQKELADATSALTSRLLLAGHTLETYNALDPAAKALLSPIIDPLIAAVTAADKAVADAKAVADQAAADLLAAQNAEDLAKAAVTAAQGALKIVQDAIDAAQKLLDDALALLDTALGPVQPQIDALLGAVTALLDGTPLVSLDAVKVVTRTSVTSAAAGGQSAEVIGGQVSGLRVLGTDVLSNVLGSTSIELLDLTSEQLGLVRGLVGTLTGTLSEVLSTVPGFPGLSIPAPQVALLEKTTATGVTDGFGTASAGVQLLKVSLPSITLPLGLQLPGAGSLPALAGLPTGGVTASAVGDLLSTPVSLAVGGLGPQSSFRPGVAATGTPTTGTPTAGTPTAGTPTAGTPTAGTPVGTGTPVATGTPAQQLPRTGATALAAVAGLVLLGSAALLRRRRLELDSPEL